MNASKLSFYRLSPLQEKILTSLACYKFLTTGQLLELSCVSERTYLNKLLVNLKNRSQPLVGSITFGVHPKFGKLQSVHYITAHSVELLRELFGEEYPVRHPKGKHGLFQQDYFHRVHTIEVHIAMMRWAEQNGIEVGYFCTYFDKLSSGKDKGYKAESAIRLSDNEYLIADAICLLKTPAREELYAIEMYNGNDTHRVHGSLFQHLQALKKGQPSRQFELEYGSRVLCVFEFDAYKVQAMKRLAEDERFANAKKHFLFKSLEELKTQDFFEWRLFDGEKTGLF
ncbi:hypothetical protein H9Q08_17050 [Chryseobacterium sp. PS-8]|uniref:Replication-relaxation n=1 Tax=Chryseobacterium indicum TaxID=2766954 RepID=A0ABS9C9M3_9FLAO|nr:hypothetical protein [Chryseobacterium sp. PS-8]MCF2220995.1 hypothetical protein [Chryseobacterium sp. PS-8]